MREIKFRVWNGFKIEYNVGVFNGRAYYINNDSPNPDKSSLNPMNTIYSKNISLMQYTGLHDKNGVPIYEGDICTHGSGKEGFTKHAYPVEWGLSGWLLKGTGAYLGHYYGPISNSLEVIGNIYENPELL